LNFGIALMDAARVRESRAQFSQAAQLDPINAAMRYTEARALSDFAGLDQARQELQTARKLNPEDAEAQRAIAILQALQNRTASVN
jgi:Flp pilus assembly protein TadD